MGVAQGLGRKALSTTKRIRPTFIAAGLVLVMSLFVSASAGAACPNEAFRAGASSGLPDCRAYELVSPPNTNGRFLYPISSFAFAPAMELFPTELASPAGNSVVFETYNGPLVDLPDPNGDFDLYQAERQATGWQTVRRVTPSGSQAVTPSAGGVASDHQYAFTHQGLFESGALPSGSLEGVYLGAPDGSFELVGKGSLGEEPLAQGRYISAGGKHVIFSTGKQQGQSTWCAQSSSCQVLKLEPDAAPSLTGTIYDREADGPTHVVSLLPPNVPQTGAQQAFYQGASKNGTSIAFEIEGNLYVRVNSGEEAGEETEEAAPAADNPVYAGLSEEGKFLFYVEGGEKGVIHRFEAGSETDEEINPANEAEVVNVSADGSHVYFISEEQIGGQGALGEPNLFVWDEGTVGFIATVAASDLVRTSGKANGFCAGSPCGVPALTRWTSYAVAPMTDGTERGPGADSSRTSLDGKVLVFESKAKLTTYDNAGHTEIYRWKEGGAGVECVSCHLGSPAAADARLQDSEFAVASMVINNLNTDGSRVFFETDEALSDSDTDGINDIYQWTEGSLAGPGLISSGQSVEYPPVNPNRKFLPRVNRLLGVTPSGSDVVFATQDDLTGEAGVGGVPAIYDARVNGGFPKSPPPQPCAEENCRAGALGSTLSSPSLQSETATGSGNVKPRKRHCRHHGGKKKRCTKKGSKHRNSQKRLQRQASSSVATADTDGAVAGPAVNSAAGSSPSAAPIEQAGSTPVTAAGEFAEFGIKSFAAGLSTSAAAQHPDFTTTFAFKFKAVNGRPDTHLNSVEVSLPPGLLGNPNAIPHCDTGLMDSYGNCPVESQVGVAKLNVAEQGTVVEPIFNLAPPHPDKEIARFGIWGVVAPIFIDVNVRTASDYGATAIVHSPPGLRSVLEGETTFWGDPTNEIHDPQRLTTDEADLCTTACNQPGGKRPVERTNKAFFTNPAACQGLNVGLQVTNYQLPGQIFAASAAMPSITDCQGLPFAPGFDAQPTSHRAGTTTGLTTKLVLPQHLAAGEPGTATMREARVTLPQGMQVNAGAANWIAGCSDAQVGLHLEVDADCPNASKLGTATITSPALPAPIEGAIFQRQPTPGHQLGLWLTADALGLHVKIPGELEPDKQTGRVTAVFKDLPQVPVEEIDLNVWGGPRAPLQTPDACGTYTTNYSFAPHSNDPVVSGTSQMVINEGCSRPFNPRLQAGTTNPVAGKYSPLIVDLERADGDQALRGFELKLPDGLLAKIKGVGRCSDAQADAGACPVDSKIGTVTALAGPGADPLLVPQPGKPTPGVYLGGPYKDSPLSVITIAPAQAGPFDLGNLVVRSGLGLDPDTNRGVVKADPLPQFFEGVGLTYRKLHVVVDRPNFTLNPTDCREMKFDSDVTSTQGTVAHPSTRFKVNGCKRLKFAPKLKIELKGGTDRADYPALTATLKARKGDANIARASVALPHSEFLAQEHIVTICTRKQFAADKCPKGSVYGRAKAWTPLLAKPLSGPVYLRSSDNPLPDMVAALHGELDVNLVGRIDSTKNGGIRTTFDSVPDAPVTKFVLKMRGGKKSLITNSTDVCIGAHRATAAFRAQNGRGANLRPPLVFKGCGKAKGKKKGK